MKLYAHLEYLKQFLVLRKTFQSLFHSTPPSWPDYGQPIQANRQRLNLYVSREGRHVPLLVVRKQVRKTRTTNIMGKNKTSYHETKFGPSLFTPTHNAITWIRLCMTRPTCDSLRLYVFVVSYVSLYSW